MAKKSINEPVFDKTRNRWKVTIPAGLTTDNKRVRSWHATREAARAYITGITTTDSPAAAIAPKLAMLADEAREILAPFNLDLVQCARDHAAARKELDGTGTLLEAVKAFCAAQSARKESKPMCEAVELYLDARQDLRKATVDSYKYTLEKLLLPLHHKLMSEITTMDIEEIMSSRAPTARAMHRRNLGAFWAWACKKPRAWASMDTLEALEVPRVSNDADIAVLTAPEVRALLTAAEAEGPGAAIAYAIAVFGGVRMGELGKLQWGDIHEDHIEIGRDVAKKHSRRLVPICPTLRSWIHATRGDAADDTLITPPCWTEVSKCVRRRAGWAVEARYLKNPPKPTRGPWPANSPRHTCASVQVAIGTPLDDLVFKFGHSGGHDILRGHYVSRLTKKDALEILAIGPNKSKVKLLTTA